MVGFEVNNNKMKDFLESILPTEGEKFLMLIGGFIGGVFSYAVGGMDDGIIWLSVLVIIDYLTGSVTAFKTGQWSSETGFKGLLKKVIIFLVVTICNGIDKCTGHELLRDIAIFAYAVNEAGSILENIDRLGFGRFIPAFLRAGVKALKHDMVDKVRELKDKGEKKDDNSREQ